MKKINFWEDFGSDGSLYQMGPRAERIEVFDILEHYDCHSMLDVGCGTGPMYELLVKHKIPIRYKGVDYSGSFIKTCKDTFPEGNWQKQDARRLKEHAGSFDAVVLLHCLDHVDDVDSVLREANRVARKLVVIVLWRPFVDDNDKRNLNSKNKDFVDSHLSDYNKPELDTKIFESNFSILDEYEVGDDRYNYIYILGKK